MLEGLKNYNVTEMLFVMKEESGVNNLKNVVLNIFFLNNDDIFQFLIILFVAS